MILGPLNFSLAISLLTCSLVVLWSLYWAFRLRLPLRRRAFRYIFARFISPRSQALSPIPVLVPVPVPVPESQFPMPLQSLTRRGCQKLNADTYFNSTYLFVDDNKLKSRRMTAFYL